MTDAPTTQPTKPQRAARTELPPLPEHDPHENASAQTQRGAEHDADAFVAKPDRAPRLSEDTSDEPAGEIQNLPVDDRVGTEDPYANITEVDRPANFVRQPFGEAKLRLQAPARPGYRRYWFNDTPGRIQAALAGGYMFVKQNGRNVRNVVGRAREGGAQVSYLMEIPEDWYLADMAAQQRKVDDIDAAIKGGTINEKGGTQLKDGDNRYIPKEGIRYNPKG